MDIQEFLNQEGYEWEDLVYYILGNNTKRTLREMESGDLSPLTVVEINELEKFLLEKAESVLFTREECANE